MKRLKKAADLALTGLFILVNFDTHDLLYLLVLFIPENSHDARNNVKVLRIAANLLSRLGTALDIFSVR